MEEPHRGTVSRRATPTRGGVGGVALAGGRAGRIGADPGPGSVGSGTTAVPVGLAPIASAALEGVSYRYLTMFDFTPENGDRAWTSDGGTYSSTGAAMWASMDLPAGAVLRDIEWYTANADQREGLGRIWQAGSSNLGIVALDVPIAADTNIHASRAIVPAGSIGPYPNGTNLQLGMYTTGSNVVNGVRVGFSQGPLSTILLATPVRAYDSRSSGGDIAPHETRAISLASALPVGAVGALINLSLTETKGAGSLRVGSSSATPVATGVQWSRSGDRVTSPATTRVSAGRQIAVKSVASGSTRLVVDVIGYLV